MNLRRKTPPDSLYLLLDTLCNAFGGIILLAVLVVLLTSKEKSQRAPAKDSAEMTARRLAIAQSNLRQSEQLSGSLQAKADDKRWKQQMILLSTRKDLQETIQQLRDNLAQAATELETTNAADPAGRLKSLTARQADARARQLDEKNSLSAAEENIKRLTRRLADLQNQVSAKLADSERALRLPKEHETGKRVVYVIVHYDRYYPCNNIDSSRNETDIKWVPFIGGREIAVALRDHGLDLNGLAAYLSELSPNDDYVAFCTYDDSFSAFIAARQMAADKGIAYGWEPFRTDVGGVIFSGSGYVPKAQ
jgi:hypothetical protein